jgi:hypothetical protein
MVFLLPAVVFQTRCALEAEKAPVRHRAPHPAHELKSPGPVSPELYAADRCRYLKNPLGSPRSPLMAARVSLDRRMLRDHGKRRNMIRTTHPPLGTAGDPGGTEWSPDARISI